MNNSGSYTRAITVALCMFTSHKQISPPSLVLKLKISEVSQKWIPNAVELKRIPTHKTCKCKKFCSQTRLVGEIYLSDVIMHRGYSGGDPFPLVGTPRDLHTQLPLLEVPRNVSSLKPCWLLAIFVLFLRQEREQGKKNSRFKFKFISRLQK